MRVSNFQPQTGPVRSAPINNKKNTMASSSNNMNADTIRFSALFHTEKSDNAKLLKAAETDDIDAIYKVLDRKKAKVDHQQKDTQKTALHISAERGNYLAAKNLLQKNARTELRDRYGETPLHLAAKSGSNAIIDLLSTRVLDMVPCNNNGQTPLHLAAMKGYLTTAETLIRHGAKINLIDDYGISPIGYAERQQHTQLVNYLKSKPGNNTSGTQARNTQANTSTDAQSNKEAATRQLLTNAANGRLDRVNQAISNGAMLTATNRDGWTPLTLAASGGYNDIIMALHDKGVDVCITSDTRGYTPMSTATEAKRPDTIKLLFNLGAPVNIPDRNGMTPLQRAQVIGHPETIKTIKELIARGERNNSTQDAGASSNYERTEGPSDKRTRPDTSPLRDKTQILFNLVFNGTDTTESLNAIENSIAHGANILAVDGHGKTVIDYAPTDKIKSLLKAIMANETADYIPSRPAPASVHSNNDNQSLHDTPPTGEGVLSLITNDIPLSEMGTEWVAQLNYQALEDTADLLKAEVCQDPDLTEPLQDLIKENYYKAAPNPGQEDSYRDVRLFLDMVSKRAFGKRISELGNNEPKGFNAVVGMNDLKEELTRLFIRPLNRFEMEQQAANASGGAARRQFQRVNDPSNQGGILLYGAPGTGKSFLSKMLAHELDMEPIYVRRSDIVRQEVGASELRLKNLFENASKQKPCALIFDEVNSVLHDRKTPQLATHELNLTEEMIRQLESARSKGIVVIASTNYLNRIDEAARDNRPSRFSLVREVPLGNEIDRARMLKAILTEVLERECLPYTQAQIQELAQLSEGLSNDALRAICNQADARAAEQDLEHPSLEMLRDEIQLAQQHR